ncbi:MAG: PE-PPE domain-containing protein [Mycobacterium sp.]
MHHGVRPYFTAGVAVVGASLIVVSPVAPAAPAVHAHAIQLTGVDTADSPLGDGTAFVMGGSTIPVPGQRYLDAVDSLYLQPRGFGGTVQGLFTPEGLYPLTGVKSLPFDTSAAQGQQILDSTILGQIAGGHVDADNPVVVFGWSQSATISSLTMPQLAGQGVPSDDVHFVLVGDVSAPAGGLLERFDVPIDGQSPTVPALGITFSGATPSDLYPTDIYTTEYDLFADFPRYPIDFLSDLNAYLGIIEHAMYPVLTPDELASAIQLPTSAADTLTNYYMIPAETLPLLVPLQLLPVIGQPLYDLLEPDMRILVNLGYGSIDQGWDPGPADVPTTFGLFPDDLNWGDVLTALANGVPQGIEAAIKDLLNPANYDLSSILDNPLLTTLVSLVHTLGFTDATDVSHLLNLPTLLEMARNALSGAVGFPTSDASLFTSSPTEIVNDLTGTLSADYAALLPIADTFNTLLTTVPAVLASFVTEQLADGNLLDAIGDPIAAGLGLIPFAFIYGAGVPIFEALAGTAVNLADLSGLGG